MDPIEYALDHLEGSRLMVCKIPESRRPDALDIAAMRDELSAKYRRNEAMRAASAAAASKRPTQ